MRDRYAVSLIRKNMFQITILDQSLAKLISPPKFLKEILEEMKLLISEEYINPEIIEDIHEFFPSLLIVKKLSSKARVKRYRIHGKVQNLIDQAEKNNLTNQEKSYLADIKDYASLHCGVSDTQYRLLREMAEFPLEKLQLMVDCIKDHPELTKREIKIIKRLTVFNNLLVGYAIKKIYDRLKDKIDYSSLIVEYDDFTLFKHIKPDPTTYDRVIAILKRRD